MGYRSLKYPEFARWLVRGCPWPLQLLIVVMLALSAWAFAH